MTRTWRAARRVLPAFVAAAACARRPTAHAYPAGAIAGYYTAAFEEASRFRACDRRVYRIAPVGDFEARYRRLYAGTPERERPPRAFVVLDATVGAEEADGSFPGGTVRPLTVARVYHMSRASSGDECARWLANR